jgi:hypothetical protein
MGNDRALFANSTILEINLIILAQTDLKRLRETIATLYRGVTLLHPEDESGSNH